MAQEVVHGSVHDLGEGQRINPHGKHRDRQGTEHKNLAAVEILEGGHVVVCNRPENHALQKTLIAENLKKAPVPSRRGLFLCADAAYAGLVAEYPESSYAPTAVYKRALMFSAQGNAARAKELYLLVISRYPKSPEATFAAEQLKPR